MRHKLLTALLSVGLLLGLSACSTTSGSPNGDSSSPATFTAAQKVASKNFAIWVKQVPSKDTLEVTNHSGRSAIGGNCQNGQGQLVDGTAVYVTKTFDTTAFLDTFKAYLAKQNISSSRAADSQKNPYLAFTENNYQYQLISLSHVKKPGLDSNKALLFSVTTPCASPK